MLSASSRKAFGACGKTSFEAFVRAGLGPYFSLAECSLCLDLENSGQCSSRGESDWKLSF